jgi:tetratricopeptide (TPR) repeat protein
MRTWRQFPAQTIGRAIAPAIALVLLNALGPAAVQAEGTAADRSIQDAQRLLKRHPRDAGAYYRLGDAYIQKARETGDVAYFDRAEAALRTSLGLTPQASGVIRHLAYVLYSRHAFAEAAIEAARAIALDPADRHAYGILGDAQLEVGRYAEAEETYGRMLALGGDLYSWSRRAGLRSLRGDPDGAIADLEQAIDDGRAAGRPAESVAWAEWQLATEHLHVGDLSRAEARYGDALVTYPRYHRALAALGQVRAAQGRFPEAIALLQEAIAIVPQPDYVVALGDVLARTGRTDEARQAYALVEYIGRLSALNQVLYNRELAYFYADHDTKLDQALSLATRELEVRRDVYAYDLLAWARYKNGQPTAAREAMAEALKLGTRDARLFFHAGLIEGRLGHRAAARDYLRRALTTNPQFHVLQAEEARRALADLETEGQGTPVAATREEARHGQ